MVQDKVLLEWLESLAIYGFSIITNSPHDVTVARQLGDRIGYIKRTTYGEEFEVKSKDNARNYAYMMTPLPLHTDMPYYEYKAGINILHCYVQSQSQGGSNHITDGFHIAEKLRKGFPKLFEILVETPVDWYDIGKDSGMSFHNIWRAPTICLDIDGRYHRINENSTTRDSHFSDPLQHLGTKLMINSLNWHMPKLSNLKLPPVTFLCLTTCVCCMDAPRMKIHPLISGI